MNKPPQTSLALRISSAAAFAALVSMQIVACSDDENHPAPGDTEAGTGGDEGTGGTGSGGRASGGAGGGAAGTGAKDGAGGGSSGAGGSSGGDGGGGKEAGAPETGPGSTPDGGVPDASTEPDAAPDGPPGPPPCAAPSDPDKASVCLSFDPEIVKLIDSDPELDGKGTLFVDVFDHQPADPAEQPFASLVYPSGVADSGSGYEETDLYSLPELSLDGLPETVYIRTIFADSILYTVIRAPISYGGFFGGVDLTQGFIDLQTGAPKNMTVRTVTLKKGEGTRVKQRLTALRKFTTKVSLDVALSAIADDAQGVISVGAFDVAAPAGAPVLGGNRSGCVKLADPGVSPFEFQGFVYGTGDFWLGGQLDDFDQHGLSKPGSIVSLGGGPTGQQIPAAQKFTITDQYSIDIPKLSLNVVLPGSTGLTPYPCP